MGPRFEGRVAMVTGGANGIGAATAGRLAAEGASVAVIDFDGPGADRTAAAIGGNALAVRCDVTRRSEVDAAAAATVERFGRLDILVCCAGIIRDDLVHRMSEEDWDGVIDTHLKGSFLCAQAAQARMVPARYGRIVLLSSTSALGNRGQVNYSVAKAGLQAMARTLAIELGPFGITANAVAPGFVETAMTRATAARVGVEFEDFRQAAAERNAVGRTGLPEDIAQAVAFFAAEEAGYVTGQTLYVRGGP